MKNGEVFTLKNGMRVLCLQKPNFHTTSVRIKIFAGSLHEKVIGSAHFFEHIAFQGTKDFPDQKSIEEYCNSNALYKNAYTSQTETVFYVDGLEMKPTLHLAVQLAFHPLITKSSLEKERNAIVDEARGYQFAPGAAAREKQHEAVGGKRYARLITGNIDDIEKITHNDLIDFHKKNYHTSNSLIIICSNKPILEQKRLLESLIDDTIPTKDIKPTTIDIDWLQMDNEYSLENNELDVQSQTYISIFYRLASPKTYKEFLDRETAAIVMKKIAHRHLRQDLVMCYSASAALVYSRNQNFGISESFDGFVFYTSVNGTATAQAIEELKKIPKLAYDDTDLIKSVIKSSTYDAALMLEQTTANYANSIAHGEQVRINSRYDPKEFLENVENSSVSTIRKVIMELTKELSVIEVTSPQQEILDNLK